MWQEVSFYGVELEQLLMETGRITSIKRKGRGRYSVFLDGCFAFSVSDESIVKFGLCVHDVLDSAMQDKLIDLEQEEQALNCALQILSYRPRSTSEIDEKLRSKGFSSKTRENVLVKLINAGYLDDVRFAELWVNYRIQEDNMGSQRIRRELLQKGISREIIDSSLEHMSFKDEFNNAMTVAEKRLPRYKNVSSDVRKRRLVHFLLRRGFSCEVATKVLNSLEI